MAVRLQVDVQCGACGALAHQGDPPQKFCACCGAAFERYCLQCRRRVDMYFEEWWPEDHHCVRTYTPAKRCPSCNSGLEVQTRDSSYNDTSYNH